MTTEAATLLLVLGVAILIACLFAIRQAYRLGYDVGQMDFARAAHHSKNLDEITLLNADSKTPADPNLHAPEFSLVHRGYVCGRCGIFLGKTPDDLLSRRLDFCDEESVVG